MGLIINNAGLESRLVPVATMELPKTVLPLLPSPSS